MRRNRWFRPWAFLAAKYKNNIEIWFLYDTFDGVQDSWRLTGVYTGNNPPANLNSRVNTRKQEVRETLLPFMQDIRANTTRTKAQMVNRYYNVRNKPKQNIRSRGIRLGRANRINPYNED